MLGPSSVSVGDPASGQVVGRKLDLHSVAGKDPDVVLPHLSRDRRQHVVPSLLELHPEHRARQGLGDLAFDLDLLLFGYYLPPSTLSEKPRSVSAVGRQNTAQHGSRRAQFMVANLLQPPP